MASESGICEIKDLRKVEQGCAEISTVRNSGSLGTWSESVAAPRDRIWLSKPAGFLQRGFPKTDATVDVRFIAATNNNPFESIQNGDLRKDLHYRLRVVPIHIPPLRERPEDIPILATAFLQEFWAQHRGLSAPPARFSEDALTRLSRAPWPGNVRELRNVVEHAVVMAEPDSSIRAADLVFVDEPDQLTSAAAHAPAPNTMDYHAARDHVLSQFEVGYLTQLVRDSAGNISDAARQAGVDRTTLYRLMEKHGIER